MGSYGFLKTPRWLALTVLVVVIAAVFVSLGLWQLQRHEERAVANQVKAARLEAPPSPLRAVLAAAGDDRATLELRRVTATGAFHPEDELLWRGKANDGRSGYHVLTPFHLSGGSEVVLVDRGWIPLTVGEEVPVEGAPPPNGEVEILGLVRSSQEPGALGPPNPPLPTDVVPRVDLDHLAGQLDEDLLGVWLQLVPDDRPPGSLPVRPDLPDTDDPGPHLGYALQWFAFTVIGVVGYGFLIRRAARSGGSPA